MRLALLMALTAAPLWAETPLSGDDYNARVAGRTYVINVPGEPPYGIEAYLPDRRVTWGFLATGECLDGTWDEVKPGTICYAYDDGEDRLHCWQYQDHGNGGFLAQLVDPSGKPLNDAPFEIEETALSLPCVSDFLGS